MAPGKRVSVYVVEHQCTKEEIVAGWFQKQATLVGDPGADEEQQHRHTQTCYIVLCPGPGQQYNLTDEQKHMSSEDNSTCQYGKV